MYIYYGGGTLLSDTEDTKMTKICAHLPLQRASGIKLVTLKKEHNVITSHYYIRLNLFISHLFQILKTEGWSKPGTLPRKDQPGLRYLTKEDEGSGHKRGEAIAQKREKMRAR